MTTFDPVYGPIGESRGVWLHRTREGWLLQWERGTTRHTIGWRRQHGFHRVKWPMTEVEKRRRQLATDAGRAA